MLKCYINETFYCLDLSKNKYCILKCFQLLTPMNAVLLNLAFADSGIAMLGNPVAFYNALSGDWMFSRKICIFYGFMMSLCGKKFIIFIIDYSVYEILKNPIRHSFI